MFSELDIEITREEIIKSIGHVNNVNNHQGITLLSVLGKFFTRIVYNRLTDWAETYQIYIYRSTGRI